MRARTGRVVPFVNVRGKCVFAPPKILRRERAGTSQQSPSRPARCSPKWVTVHRGGDIYMCCRRVPLAEVYCPVPGDKFHIAYTNETRDLGIEVTPACGGVAIFPAPIVRGVGWVSNETAEAPDSRCVVWRQYPCPDATVGVLKVSLKDSRYSLDSCVHGVALRIIVIQ